MTSPATFALPVHQKAQGPTDPSKARLPNPFTVVIAGGSRGVGLGIAKAYTKAGATGVVLSSRTASDLDKAGKSLLDINPALQIHCQACDNGCEDDVRALVEVTRKVFGGRLDVLVIAAGAAPATNQTRSTGYKDWPAGLVEEDPSEFERLFKVNVHGPFLLHHYFLPLLEQSKDGAQAIVLLTSAAGFYMKADVMPMSYSLTKLAATRLMEHAHEGHAKNGVVAFAVQPGGVKTDLGSQCPEGKGWEECKCSPKDKKMCYWGSRY